MILVKTSSVLDYDELLDEAIRICVQYDRASASLFQRRLEIGYARAARLVDQLEFAGILGHSEGSGTPRQVLVNKVKKFKKKSLTFKEGSKEYLISCSEMIRLTLLAYGIQIRISSIEVYLDKICFFMEVSVGTKLDRVINLKKELALALASPSGKVEIFAPFKGTSLVAVYLPTNKALKRASYRAINTNFEIKPPSNKYIYAIKIFTKESLLRFSTFIYKLAYRI